MIGKTWLRRILPFCVFMGFLMFCSWIGTQGAESHQGPLFPRSLFNLQIPEPDAASEPADTAQEAPASDTVAKMPAPTTVLDGAIRPGETFSQALARLSLDQPTVEEIVSGLAPVVDFRRCMPGEAIHVSLDDQGNLVRCLYEKSPFDVYALQSKGDGDGGFSALQVPVELERHVVKFSGEVEDSLFSAFSKLGLDDRVTLAFADIFSSKIDFNTETQSGDHFDLVFEKYFKKGRFVGYGRILAARYTSSQGTVEAYFYRRDGKDAGSYYEADGQAVGTFFLRSPLPFYRVTSRFSNSRLHPILGIRRPHHGVDLAAPTGTPIMAPADGRVEFVGWQNGYGRTVILKHIGGYQTYYGHLSRFARGLKKGLVVHQKDVIGYVGMTGLATGPHLDYRIKEGRVFVNPFGLKFKPKMALTGTALARFKAERGQLQAMLEQKANGYDRLVDVQSVQGPPDGWLG